jgi:hypothetical protein
MLGTTLQSKHVHTIDYSYSYLILTKIETAMSLVRREPDINRWVI